MKIGIIVVLALLAAAIATQVIFADLGYVAISIRGYLIETNVMVLVLALGLAVFAILFLLKLLAAPRLVGEAAGRYRAGRAGQKLTAGMIEVAEGNYARGEKLLARAASSSDTPLFNYLQAARAAHLQGEDERRDDWLKLAYEQTPEAANAVFLTQAEFQLDRGHHEQALATLRRLEENSREHSYALALLGRLYYRLKDWPQLGEILPRVEKQGRVKTATLDKWATRVHCEALTNAAGTADLDAAFKAIPKRLKASLELLEAYFNALIRLGETDRAEKELSARLKTDWRGPLVRLYGLIESSDTNRQLKRAEEWLAKHADDPELLLSAARLCLRNELWGKARSYLETVISLKPSPEAYQDYGHLLNRMGEGDAAAQAFRDGLGMVAETRLTRIPHLDADQA
ncbi:MAG: heme biosynthesis HemY N-terminal domain-containing protein [Pseudomonadota bacterium]